MPSVSDSFPNVDCNSPEKLILAVKCEDVVPSYQWSQEINISIFNEQYVRIPQYGDIKLSIKKSSSTVVVTIDSVTEVSFLFFIFVSWMCFVIFSFNISL